ncbi:TB2/DP1, HVA22 family-domain-containing protein [Cokeromyces recurvatus]|uniref:TB2/DP1, HVA22 family-domain-containing protein n=1 Tax=Cokeromyces recurvatus TaxID=90255 RepID=UPI00221F36FC|nr:TB2/DP1, HVA22 family-domain-containing protein [Cokeromyces recurvatus]KAI7900085.1 TB2/DP1, HVA22 family-domain-containing protein [Cokeromyces recurvatus]
MSTPVDNSTSQAAQAQAAAMNMLDLVKNKANYYLTSLDRELSKHECANEIERRTGLPKAYVVLGTAFVCVLMIFFNLAAQLLTNALAWVYPSYASFKAIESPSTTDDTQWLTYWTVLGFVQIIEYFSDILLYWFPFYYTFKTIFILWLILPQFRGAQFVYERFLRPFLLNAQPSIERHTNAYTSQFGATPVEKTQ